MVCLIIPKCSRVTSEFKALQFVAGQLQIALWDVMFKHCCSITANFLFSHILKYLYHRIGRPVRDFGKLQLVFG